VNRLRRFAPLVALAVLLGGCTDVVDGAGTALRAGSGGPSSGNGGPSSVDPSPAAPTGCPRVVYPGAQLTFRCITTAMRAHYDGNVWPVSERQTVESATGWFLEEGAGHWGSADGAELVDIALTVRQQMIDDGSYGTQPAVRTRASRPTHVDGRPGYLVQTTFDINPAWARSEGTKVRQERLWLLAIEIARNDVSLWYVSVPDLTKQLWSKVPATIASIRVG
jgi:hypothetical protein